MKRYFVLSITFVVLALTFSGCLGGPYLASPKVFVARESTIANKEGNQRRLDDAVTNVEVANAEANIALARARRTFLEKLEERYIESGEGVLTEVAENRPPGYWQNCIILNPCGTSYFFQAHSKEPHGVDSYTYIVGSEQEHPMVPGVYDLLIWEIGDPYNKRWDKNFVIDDEPGEVPWNGKVYDCAIPIPPELCDRY